MSSVKLSIVIVAILCYIVDLNMVSAKAINENDNEKHRHRRRSNYDRERYYDRYDNSRYYDRIDNIRHEELLSEITRLLQEISFYVRQPPSPPSLPPQIIYVPYPISYPGEVSFFGNGTNLKPRIIVDDDRRIWNIVPGKNLNDMDNGNDGARPITLDESSEPEISPPEADSNQARKTTTTPAPQIKSRVCQAAIVICCNESDEPKRKKCFSTYGCSKTYATGVSCHKNIVKMALEEFTNAYGPQ